MMDARDHPRGRGLRRRRLPARRARRCCSSRSTGSPAGVADAGRRGRARSGASTARARVRVAADDAERALLWKGRKSAFGAIARIAPDYYLHDAVVPRTKLVEVLRRVYEIADEHELIDDERVPRRRRQPAPADRVRPARAGRVGARARGRAPRSSTTCVDAGGVLSGEHGIGLEKRDLMPLHVHARRPRRAGAAARRVRSRRRREPAEGAARAGAGAASCSACRRARGSERRVDELAAAVATRRRGRRRSARARSGRSAAPVASARPRSRAPAGVVALRARRPDGHGRRGHAVRRARRACSPTHGQECALDPARRRRDRRRRRSRAGSRASAGSGTGRCATTCSRCASSPATAALVKGGGPTVKNVTGYDLPRLLVGSLGTLGVLVQVTLRCRPRRAGRAVVRGRPNRRATRLPARRDAVGRRARVTCCSKATPADVDAQAPRPRRRSRRAGAARRARTAAASRSRPARSRALAPRARRDRRALVRGARRRHRARRGRRPPRALGARARGRARARRLAAARGGRRAGVDGFGCALPERRR